MATQFLEDLWQSIFTPGPTPSIIKATNASFACLQLVLLVLLIATYSIHFVILSALCSGLWWAINWFATELQLLKEREERDKARAARDAPGSGDDDDGDDGGDASETEVEPTPLEAPRRGGAAATGAARSGSREVDVPELKHRANLAPPPADYSAGTQSSASTEDEWERVSEAENEKDK